MSPPHPGHSSGNSSPTRAISFAQAIREVSCERGFWFASQHPPIVRHGALISEAPPLSEPFGGAFPQRNRIVSGMSLGTIVVQTMRATITSLARRGSTARTAIRLITTAVVGGRVFAMAGAGNVPANRDRGKAGLPPLPQ